jgi:N-acetylmuramoyl-L-alanine amidase
VFRRITHIILHHTGAEEKNAEQVRRYHLRRGYRDVGYNFIIEPRGKVVIGRSLLLPGAHCQAGNMNFRSIGVALIGNLELRQATPLQVQALQNLVRKLREEFKIPGEKVLCHRQVPGARTLCPGRYFPGKEEIFAPTG